jgi:hypothetical protein
VGERNYVSEKKGKNERLVDKQERFGQYQETWIIHESRLLQMKGTGHAAVVVLRKCPVTKKMR